MPRKTKEQNELEDKKIATKTVKETKKATTKKAVVKKDDVKPATKKTTTKKTTSKTATKKPVAKKDDVKPAVKKTTTKKTTSKTATKKSSAKKVVSKKYTAVEYYDLPYRYNQTVVKVLAQTPTNLFIYWDISDDDRENFKKQYGDNFFETTKPVLIIHNDTMNYSFEIDINDFANSWYLTVTDSKCDYRVEIGRRPIVYNEKINTDYIYVSESNEIESPNDHVLLEKIQPAVTFRNIKNNYETTKTVSELIFNKTATEIYNIYELYKLIYKKEIEREIFDFANPSSGNPSSGSFSSKFK